MYLRSIPERLMKLLFPEAENKMASMPSWLEAAQDMMGKYETYERYYSGRIFDSLADPKRPEESEKKYPLKLNLSRQWANMLSGYLWGQWDQSVISFTVSRKPEQSGDIAGEEEKRCASMEDVLRRAWSIGSCDKMADKAAIDCMTYGGVIIKPTWDILATGEEGIRTEWLAPDIFIPRWHPFNINQLFEVICTFVVQKVDARDMFGVNVSGMPEDVLVWERWSKDKYVLMVDDKEVRLTDNNPVGRIPHIYIPRLVAGADNYGYYGQSAIEDIMAIQDEVNSRAADIGDGVAYASHPIRCIGNYTGPDLEVGPDAIWDMGHGFSGREPKAWSLDVHTNYNEAMEFVREVERFGRGSVGLPPIAFGEDEGSQRSGTTLLLRFLPLTQEVKRMRLHWADGLKSWARQVLAIATQHKEEFGGVFFEDKHINRVITPNFAPILPKDVDDMVNTWSLRIESGFGTPEEAYEDLGHPEPKKAADKALEYLETVAETKTAGKGAWNGTGTTTGNSARVGKSSQGNK